MNNSFGFNFCFSISIFGSRQITSKEVLIITILYHKCMNMCFICLGLGSWLWGHYFCCGQSSIMDCVASYIFMQINNCWSFTHARNNRLWSVASLLCYKVYHLVPNPLMYLACWLFQCLSIQPIANCFKSKF